MLTKAWRRPRGKGYDCVMASPQSQSLKKTAPEPAGPSCASFPQGRENPHCEVRGNKSALSGTGRYRWEEDGMEHRSRSGPEGRGEEHRKAARRETRALWGGQALVGLAAAS